MTTRRIPFHAGRAVALLTALAVTPLIAQDQQEAKQEQAQQKAPQVSRVLRVQHIDAGVAADLLREVAYSRSNNSLGILTVTATEEQVNEFESALREIDQPPLGSHLALPDANVVLTVYFLGVGGETPANAADVAALHPVIEELRRHFPYQDYSLLETFAIRATPQRNAEVEGVMPGSTEPSPATYGFKAVIDRVTGEEGQELVDFHEVVASWRLPVVQPNGPYYSEVQMRTKLRVPASKMVVVGKAGAAGVTDGLFVVLRADVVR